MSSASERVRRLAAQGAIDQGEAARLLSAMASSARATNRRAAWLDPFGHTKAWLAWALAAGALGLSLASALGFGVRFDGAFDLHVGALTHVRGAVALVDQMAAVAVPISVFYALSRVVARGVRLVDVALVVMLARLPLAVVAIPIALVTPRFQPGTIPQLSPLLGITVALSLLGIVFHLIWLYRGFRTAVGLTGARAMGTFIAGALLSELLSKVVIALLAR